MKIILIFTIFFGILSCDSAENIIILKVNKAVYTGSQADPLAKACSNWELSLKDVKTIFMLSKEVQREELHHRFYHLPCEIKGEALLNDKPISFTLNGASYIKINADKFFYKACDTEKCKPLFLMSPESNS